MGELTLGERKGGVEVCLHALVLLDCSNNAGIDRFLIRKLVSRDLDLWDIFAKQFLGSLSILIGLRSGEVFVVEFFVDFDGGDVDFC